MMESKYSKIFWLALLAQLVVVTRMFAQQNNNNSTADELFNNANRIPKEKENFPKIISTLKLALQKDANNTDSRLFLGRVYTWNNNLDSARYQFNQVLAKQPNNIEAYTGLFDLEYWNNNYQRALDHVNQGMLYDPNSVELVTRKAKVLSAMKNDKLALGLYSNYKNMDTLKSFLDVLNRETTKNMISLGYEYVYFDQRFPDPWHFSYIDYSRNTKIGYVTGRLWYSNRLGTNGLQGELEAYPVLSEKVYAYVGVGASDASIFPKFRAGGSIYFVLPKKFDAEMGMRYLNFNPSETYLAVIGVGKYVKNWYINAQSYLSLIAKKPSQSHTLFVRYYFSDRFNQAGIQFGTGISPDDRLRNIDQNANFKSYKIGLNYSRDIVKNLSIATTALWYYEEYAPKTWGNQIGLSASINKRF